MDMLEFGNIYPSVLNWALVGIMSITFIAVFKFLLAKYPIPGLTDLIASI
jgi:hypothetical protein